MLIRPPLRPTPQFHRPPQASPGPTLVRWRLRAGLAAAPRRLTVHRQAVAHPPRSGPYVLCCGGRPCHRGVGCCGHAVRHLWLAGGRGGWGWLCEAGWGCEADVLAVGTSDGSGHHVGVAGGGAAGGGAGAVGRGCWSVCSRVCSRKQQRRRAEATDTKQDYVWHMSCDSLSGWGSTCSGQLEPVPVIRSSRR